VREERRLRVFENSVLRRIFGSKRDEVTGEWKKLYKGEVINDVYSSTNILRVIKSKRMKWAGDVAHMGEGRSVYRVSVENPRKGDHWGDPGGDGRLILRRIIMKLDVGLWTGLRWLSLGTGDGHL
jgi:hypothetical protein